MFHDQQDLTALISSRICHDLISPLGAISNGLELLSMSDQMRSPELDLIRDSITNANSKIRFFRIAYGKAPENAVLGQKDNTSIVKDYFEGGRVDILWHATKDAPRRDIKLVFLGLQCLETALPFGGQISVVQQDVAWKLEAKSEKLQINPRLWSLLEGREMQGALAAAQVHFGLLGLLAQGRDPKLAVTMSDNLVQITL